MEIAILFALIFLNGLFAMSEIALVTARKVRLQKLIDEGDSGAAAAVKLGEDPTRFLSTIQIGITLIGILMGVYSSDEIASGMSDLLVSMGASPGMAETLGLLIVVLIVTLISIVIGELVPKRIGLINPEKIAKNSIVVLIMILLFVLFRGTIVPAA